MKKNISIVLALFFVFGGVSVAIAETDGTASASVETSSSLGLPPSVPKPPVSIRDARAEMEARANALRASSTVIRKDFRASTTAAIKDMRGEMKENREQMEARAKALRASSTAMRENMKDEQLKKRLEMAHKATELVVKRLDTAIERVQKLSDRVSERLTKFEANGANVTVPRSHLAEAKIKLDLARTQSASIKLEIETVFATSTTATTTPKDAFKNVKALVKEATETIREAHRHVALAISTIKPGQNKPHATSTTATTTQ